MNSSFLCACAAVATASFPLAALADDWNMFLTVDNQFDAYFGTPTTTNFYAGGGNNWQITYNFVALNRLPTDYMYVATASDHSVAQGFIGTFTNTTTNLTINTGNIVWEVFAAGAHPQTNPFWPNPWPSNLMPTQAEVDAAILFAETNALWVPPDTFAGYTNGVAPWGTRPNIPASAEWIWHATPGFPNPFTPGHNHDEFLVFRVAGAVPTPGAAPAILLPVLTLTRRRR